MSRSWNTWLARWKAAMSPSRRNVRRRMPLRVRLGTESLEPRVTPAVLYGMGIGRTFVPVPPTPPPPPPPPDLTPPTLQVNSLTSTLYNTVPTITGTVSDNNAGSTLAVSLDGGTQALVPLGTNGSFSYTPILQLGGSNDGQQTLTFIATDAAGNKSQPASVTFTLDSQPPTIHVDDLGGTTFSDNQTITGTVADNNPFGRTLTVSVDGGPVASVLISTVGEFSYTTQFPLDGTKDGQHTFTFVAHDNAGNTSAPAQVSFNLATTTAGLTLQLDPSSANLPGQPNKTTLANVTLTGTGPANSTITLTQTGATTQSDANGAYKFTSVPLSSGSNTLTTKVTANGQTLQASVTVIRDNAPTVAAPVSDFALNTGVANSVFNLPTIFSDADVNTVVQFVTNRGTFNVELFDQQVGATVANFLKYVTGTDAGKFTYDNTIFHRVTLASTSGIAVLQGGGFFLGQDANGKTTLTPIGTDPAINLQAGLTNALGTIAMARTGDPNSATSQFFFNTANNAVLDPGGGADPNGYAVFGVILGDMSAVNASAAVPPVNMGGNFAEIPITGAQANDPNFPTDTTFSQYERILGAAVISSPDPSVHDSLTFAVTGNTNPGLVTPSIVNGKLTLTYAAGVTGGSTITLTATDADGATATTSFSVSVGPDTEAPTVTINSPADNTTVKTNPTITGTAVDNTVVGKLLASVDGGPTQPVTVGGNGAFSFTPTLATDGTADGPHKVTFTATDPSGNSSTPVTLNFTLDTTAPVLNITFPTSPQTFQQTPTITGTATDNIKVASLTASVDGQAAQAVNVDAQNNFGFTPTGLADGAHTVTFVATDAAGNQSAVATVTFTLDSRLPAVHITSPAADGQTFKANPAITGTVSNQSEASILTASVDNGTPVAVTVDGQGNFSFTPTATGDGSHIVTFSAGSTFAPVSRTFILDETGPAITVSSPANGQTFNFDPTIIGKIVDPGSGVATATASVDGANPQILNLDAQGNFSFIPPIASGGVSDGPHTVTISATDKLGNVSTPVPVTFTLDTAPPTINVTSPLNGQEVTTSPDFTGTVTDNLHVSTLTVSVDGGAAQPVSFDAQGHFTFNPALKTDGSADGGHNIIFTATDGGGNVKMASVFILLDTQAPTVTITSPADNQTFTTNITVNGKADDAVGAGFVNVLVDGVQVDAFNIPTNGPFSYTTKLALDGSANGPHTVSFIASDAAQHQSAPATLHFTLAATPNSVFISAPPDGKFVNTNPTFVGKVFDQSEASSLTASVDGGTAVPVTVDGQGNFSFTPNVPTDGSADGTHTVVFAATGNFNPVSRSFVLDTHAPTATITSPQDGSFFKQPPAIVGKVADVGTGVGSVAASVDGGAPVSVTFDAQGNYSFTPQLVTGGADDGPHTVTITATDLAGGVSTPAVVHFTLDSVDPTVNISSPANGSTLNVSPTFVGVVADNVQVNTLTVARDGGAAVNVTFDAQGNFTFSPNLATNGSDDGVHAFAFTATDAAGNSTTVTVFITLDTTKPTVVIDSPADGQTFNTNPTIQATASDNIQAKTVNVLVDGVQVDQITLGADGKFSFTTTFKLDGTDNGQHTVTFVALDDAGNESDPVTFHFTLQAP
jgi:cyclophilin family peptidyl-prolyl cis-trans isomerase